MFVVHLAAVKKFDNCLLGRVSDCLFSWLSFFNYIFNLLINNIVKKPIIDYSLFLYFY